MIIFLLTICLVSVLGSINLVENGDKITIEWTKTEKLSISIPFYHEHKATTSKISTTTSRLDEALPVWLTTTPEQTPLTASEETISSSETTLEVQQTTYEGISTESPPTERATTTSVPTESEVTTEVDPITVTASDEMISPNGTTVEEQGTTDEGISSESIETSKEYSSTERATTEFTSTTTVATTSARVCGESDGKDFIFLLDAAVMKDRERITILMRGFFASIETDPCHRLILISFTKTTQLVLIPLTPLSQLDFGTVQDALHKINYTDFNHLTYALSFVDHRVLGKLPWRESVRERIVVVIATAEGSSNEEWRSDHQSNTPGLRATIMEQYGAQLMLVTIGQPLFPMFQYVAPPDETVSIDSFELLGTQPVDELCCRIAACGRNSGPTTSSEMCKVVKEREIIKKTVYPNCAVQPKKDTDFVFLIDRASLNHQEQIVNLVLSFVNLINPLNTHNRVHLGSYGTNRSLPHISMRERPTNDQIAEAIRKIGYQQGSDIADGIIGQGYAAFGHDGWRDHTRDRVMIIIAGGAPSLATQPTNHFYNCRYPTEFVACAQDRTALFRAWMTGKYGARMFFVTIGALPMDILKFVAPAKETVNIADIENITSHPMEEFKRRFCL